MSNGTALIRKNKVAADLLRILNNPNLGAQKTNLENVFRRRTVCDYKQQLLDGLQPDQNLYQAIDTKVRVKSGGTGVLPSADVIYFNPPSTLHGNYSQVFDVNSNATQYGDKIKVYGPPVPIVGNYKTKPSFITVENDANGNTITFHPDTVNVGEYRKEYLLHVRMRIKFITLPATNTVTIKLFMLDPSCNSMGTQVLEGPFNRIIEVSFFRSVVQYGIIPIAFYMQVSSGSFGLIKDTSGSVGTTDSSNCLEIYEIGPAQNLT